MAHLTRPVYMFAPVTPLPIQQPTKMKAASDKDTDASSDTEVDQAVSEISYDEIESDTGVDHGYKTDDDMYHPVYHMAIPLQMNRPMMAPGRFTPLPSIPGTPTHDVMRMMQMSPHSLTPHSLTAKPTFHMMTPVASPATKVWSAGATEPEPQFEKHTSRRSRAKTAPSASTTPRAQPVPALVPAPPAASVVRSPPSSAVPTPRCEVEQVEDEDRTTIMLKNLPKGLSRAMLLELLEKKGFAQRCNFVYLPVEFTRRSCMGYAFVNLDLPSMVPSFWSAFEGMSDWPVPSSKICRVTWSSPLQGLSEHVERFRNSPLMHATVPDECRPILLSGGTRVAFPAPTKTLRAPRPRASRSMRPFWQGDAGDADIEA